MRVLVCIPTFQEADNIVPILAGIRAAAETGGVDLLINPGRVGLGAAYRTGLTSAMAGGFDIVCQIDADGSFHPADLPRLVAEVEAGADLAIGSRYVPGGSIPDWRWHRRALSKYGNRYAIRMLGLPVADTASGFRAYRVEVLAAVADISAA